MQTKFISVEIALHTDYESSEWVAWFEGQDNHVTRNQGDVAKWYIFFAPLPSTDADSTIRNLCTEIDQLPHEIKQHWTNATRREFFIGYQAGSEWHCFNEDLSLRTLELVAAQKAEIRLAIYPVDSD